MIVAASYGTVSDIEVVWTLIAFVGLSLSVYNVGWARSDCQWLRKQEGPRDGRWRIARAQYLVEIARAVVQTIFLTIGISAMLLPDPPAAAMPTRYVVFGAIFRWGLILSALLVTCQSFINFRLRQTMVRIYERNRLDSRELDRDTAAASE